MREEYHASWFLRRPIVFQMRQAVRATRLDIFLSLFHGELMYLVSMRPAFILSSCARQSDPTGPRGSEVGGSPGTTPWRGYRVVPSGQTGRSSVLPSSQLHHVI